MIAWLYSWIFGGWTTQVAISSFGSALDCSFAAALAYSVLFKLGNFSGSSLDAWVYNEKLRVMSALAEDDRFEEIKFTTDLHNCRDRFKDAIRIISYIAIIWALAVLVLDVLLISFMPFHSKETISGQGAFECILFLLGPIPAGIFMLGGTHLLARLTMRGHSKEWDTLVKYSKTKPAEAIAAARREIARKLKEEEENDGKPRRRRNG